MLYYVEVQKRVGGGGKGDELVGLFLGEEEGRGGEEVYCLKKGVYETVIMYH